MYRHLLFKLGIFAAIACAMKAQTWERRATLRGGGGDRGKCTIEVVVDGAAEVEVRGDVAILRNLAGQPPQWRRFECNVVMPPNPVDFRFAGVDGRGRQQLVRDPRNGGAAVVRIEDPQNGSEGYTFDITWSRGGAPGGYRDDDRGARGDERRPGDRDRDDDAYHRGRDDWFQGENWRARFFERVRQDVEHVQSVTFPFTSDQYRLARTIQQLNELQDQLASDRFDEREFQDVVEALQRVVQDNRLSPRNRDMLTDDLNRMREFRERRRPAGGRDEDAYYRDREDWSRRENWRARLFERVRQDVEHVQSVTFPFGADQYRLSRTIQELNELQDKMAAGRYDERELDEVIGALQRVVQDNRLAPRNRDVLTDDLNRLRDFRARHDSYGVR